jgi:hypothetical protein
MECCHNNGDPADNRLENLRWDTHITNYRDAVRHGTSTRGEINGHSTLTEDKVRAMRYLRNVAKFSPADLAWQFDVTKSCVSCICTGRGWRHIL